MILTWSLVILVLAIAQNRFTYYYGVNVAILTGFLAIWVLQRFDIKEMDVEFGRRLGAGQADNLKPQDHSGCIPDISYLLYGPV